MRKRRTEESTYTVQVQGEGPGVSWRDVATVTVPARTKRKRVIEKGLADAGMTPTDGETLQVRALNADSAHVTAVGVDHGPPRLKFG